MTLTLLLTAVSLIGIFLWGYRLYRRANPATKPSIEFSNALQATPVTEYEPPSNYHTDNLTALVKDPDWLFCHWNISQQLKEDFAARFGKNHWEQTIPVMRVYNYTTASHWDVMIDDFCNSWYFRAGQPSQTFHLELGRMLPNKIFYPLLRSNRVTMPAAEVSKEIDPKWPPIEAVWQSVPTSQDLRKGLVSSEQYLHS